MDIRDATAADVPALVEASIAMGQESEGRQPDPDVVTRAIRRGIDGRARYFVADDGGVVGSLFITREWSDWNDGWYWWIQGVYVPPSRRRQGILRRLMDAVHEAARIEGVVEVRLYVERDNDAARQAYERLGFGVCDYTMMARKP